MSLRLWLPLTKNLLNYGAADSSITASNVTANANGKIGGCYSFNGSSSSLIGTQSVISNNTDDWTFACWMKTNSTSGGQTLFCCRTAVNSTGIMVLLYSETGKWFIDDGVRWQPAASISTNTWYHVCVVRKKGVGKFIYVNGVLTVSTTTTGTQSTVSSTTYSIGGALNALGQTNGNWLNGYLNDVRFYDHALSVAEIKELSKGLSIHYKLDGFGGCDNLLKYTRVNSTNKELLKTNVSSNWDNLTLTTIDGYSCYQYPTANNATWFCSGQWFKPMEANTTYTYSAWIYFTANANFNFTSLGHFQVYNASSTASDKSHEDIAASRIYSPSSIKANTWTRVSITFTTNNLAGSYFQIYPRYNIAANTGDLYFRDCKLEKGTTSTAWVPNSVDNEYNALGYDSDVVIDSSGYDNNGIKTNGVTTSSDTPRYDVCSVFNGSTGSVNITSPIFPIILNNAFTISMWIYNNDAGDRSILFGNYGLTGSFFNIEKKVNETVRFYWNGSPDITFSNSILTSGAFVHMSITRDGNTVKCYINGILKDTSATTLSGSIPANATEFRIGSDSRTGATLFKGRISDFRLYATALSADDVLALYQTGASVSKNETMFGYMMKEG